MEHNRKILQKIIDKVDPHDKLLNDTITIKVAELYAEWAIRNPQFKSEPYDPDFYAYDNHDDVHHKK